MAIDLTTANMQASDATVYMLTTVDNPHDPFTEYEDWWAYDYQAGYHTPGYLARIAITSDALSVADQQVALNQAIDEIVRENVLGIYKKVSKADATSI